MTLASGSPISVSTPSLTYPDQSLAHTPLEVRCDELLPAWSALLEALYGDSTLMRVSHIATGGSDRSFYRIEPLDGRESTVMCVTPSRSEFANYIAIGHFLKDGGLPVPAFHAWSDTTGLAVLEDAGRQALQHVVLEHGAHSREVFDAYGAVIRTLGRLQAIEAQRCCPEMICRPFSETDLRWETEYFRENFLGRHLGWDLSGDSALTADFEALAQQVLHEQLVPMHRDFQSQNVFIEPRAGSGRGMVSRERRDGPLPDTEVGVWILDFQGARLGPHQYDLASLLRDPYVSLPADVEHQLLMLYHAQATPFPHVSWDAFRQRYSLVSLQRLMQALGAYGFLSLVKAKPWFRKWITPALGLLARAMEEVEGLRRLRAVVAEARERQRALE